MTALALNPLERAVFNAICQAEPGLESVLRAMFQTARVTKRNNTGVGFYTDLEVDRSLPALLTPQKGMIDGPQVFRVQARPGEIAVMGFILWLEAGYPDCLEGYQYCAEIDGLVTDSLDLHREDLDALQPIG